jgi:glycosyltransferase involved in cell wall biosynthesis
MKIGIDLTGLWRPATGIFVYSRELAKELMKVDDQNEYTLFFSGDVHPDFAVLPENFHSIVIPVRDEILAKQVCIAILCNALGLDLIHFPALPPAAACFRPFVWTLHDATPWLYPETMDLKGRLYYHWMGGLAVRRSRRLITVSNASKRDIIDNLHIPDERVTVIYEGIDGAFRRMDEGDALDSVRARYDLPEKFILTVGTLEPRKNLPFLIDAYQRYCSVSGSRWGLVIVGRTGWNSDSISLSFTQGQIIRTGFVPQPDLVALYNLADVFVLPSLYEGFGLPPLEAMACGCPVVVSQRGSLQEVVGDAALFMDPESPDSFVGALHSVNSDRRLRATLVEKGMVRASQFSWRTAALKTLAVYNDLTACDRATESLKYI